MQCMDTPKLLGRTLRATLAALLFMTGCGTPSDSDPDTPLAVVDTGPVNPLYVDPSGYDFTENPKLLERLRQTPHGYFRFTNLPFSQEVCRRFEAEVAEAPTINLHGDAHVEQYAVTELGRGMTDFDDSSLGPAVLDLVRFGTSLRLACGQEACGEEQADALFQEFLRGYRQALEDPQEEAPEPTLAREEREAFEHDPEGYFSFVDSAMEPISDDEARELSVALGPYFEAMAEDHPHLADDFFTLERVGKLRLGVGSALDLKYLVRVRGPSTDPHDDTVLEIKQVRDIAGIPCVTADASGDPLRVLRAHLRIAHTPFRYLGYARFRGHNFWVHAWVKNYSEIDIEEAFAAPEQMAEVAFDVGWQLGLGHMKKIAEELDKQLRREQLRLLDRDAEKIAATCRDLEILTLEAWEDFKAAVPPRL